MRNSTSGYKKWFKYSERFGEIDFVIKMRFLRQGMETTQFSLDRVQIGLEKGDAICLFFEYCFGNVGIITDNYFGHSIFLVYL